MSDHTPEQRAKLLDKIKKCLALSGSPEPHEAAAAMRQAQKLMNSLGVTAEEVEAPTVFETEVKTREGYGNCRYMNHLSTLIEEAFGVEVVYSRNPGTANRLNVRYFGTGARVKLAEYTHRVLQRALEEAWATFLLCRPHLKSMGGKRQAFYIGWLFAVKRQVSTVVPPEVEQRAVKVYLARKFGELEAIGGKKQDKQLDPQALHEGMLAAAEFSLNVPLEEEQCKLEHAK
jgi:hypothetical protein